LFRLSASILDRTVEFVPFVAAGVLAGIAAGLFPGATEDECGLFVDSCKESCKSSDKHPIFGTCMSLAQQFSDDPEWF
jgi:hypothetical protein